MKTETNRNSASSRLEVQIRTAQIKLINAQNLYIIELEAKLNEQMPMGHKLRFKKYYEDARKEAEEFQKKSG